MGSENQPKFRQARRAERKQGIRKSYDRILIVTEGKKTEPNYFKEVRSEYRLNTANVGIFHGAYGTEPLKIVEYAEQLFKNGNPHNDIHKRAFEKVYIVFDKDDHHTYFDALDRVKSLHNQGLENDIKEVVTFCAISSIPCFEFWLLLHYEDVKWFMERNDVYKRLKKHLVNYEKGNDDIFKKTKIYIDKALSRAQALSDYDNTPDQSCVDDSGACYKDRVPYTKVWELVDKLRTLKG